MAEAHNVVDGGTALSLLAIGWGLGLFVGFVIGVLTAARLLARD